MPRRRGRELHAQECAHDRLGCSQHLLVSIIAVTAARFPSSDGGDRGEEEGICIQR